MEIVYATDGSPGAVAAAEFLACLPLTPADTVWMLAVRSSGGSEEEERFFREPRGVLARSAARVESEVRSGAPDRQILDCARQRAANTIVLGAMGTTGLARFFIGSTAERVLRHASTSVLVARPVQAGLRRALVGLDGSPTARRVAEAAARFPLPPETGLRLVRVLPQQAVIGAAPEVWASLAGRTDDVLKAAETEAEASLRALAQVAGAGGREMTAETLHGDPATCLITAAENEGADLVILGSAGEGGVDRFLLGAVPERVARHARCSVLVIR